jgi:hypothetical protein
MQLTVDVPEPQVSFFKELVKQLGLSVIAEDTYDEDPTPEQLKAEMRQAVRELNLVKQGKMKSRLARELLNEV